jgi:carbon monoxide dehydrogenase subunit G
MELTGEYVIPAPRATVWAALNDPEILRQCIPGCQEIAKTSDTEFTAKVGLAIGPVRANFTGRVTLSDMDPPNGYTITGEGQGGVAGFGKGSAKVRLADDGAGTKLTYVADASVGGKLAQIGSRLVEGTSRRLAEEFFGKFSELLTPPEPEPMLPHETAGAATASAPSAITATSSRLSPRIWIPILIIGALILWYLVATPGR